MRQAIRKAQLVQGHGKILEYFLPYDKDLSPRRVVAYHLRAFCLNYSVSPLSRKISE